MNTLLENWKDCAGFEGRYQVSDLGRVRNAAGKVLKPQTINSGYQILHLYIEGKRHVRLVHRLVGECFCLNPHGLPEINHEDANKAHNNARNLVWSSRLGNVAHAIRAGLVAAKPNAKPVIGTDKTTGRETHYPSMKDAEIALSGRASSAVNHVFSGRKKSAYNCFWRYVE